MKRLFMVFAALYLYQGYNYPYYYDVPQGYYYPALPYYRTPFVYNGVDRDFYNPSNESSWDRAWRRELEGR
jgi:hypothetical protein